MRIGIDVDGVLTELNRFTTDYLTKYLVKNNIDYQIGKADSVVYAAFGIDEKIEDDFWEEYLDLYARKVRACAFVSEVIKKLKEDGHEIYIVTARWLTNRDDEVGEDMRNKVKVWLCENDIIYDKLIFTKAKKEKKLDEIKEFKIDLMIEDSPKNIEDLSKVVPMICYHAEYNKDFNFENTTRCFSWYDIYHAIKKMSVNN